MTNWTYRVEVVPSTGVTADWLNGFGAQGWELIAVNTTFTAVAIFKKPAP